MRSSSRGYLWPIALALGLVASFYLFGFSVVGTIIALLLLAATAIAAGFALLGGRRGSEP